MYDYPVCQVLGHGAAEEHGQEATDQTGWTGQHSTRSEGRTPSVASDCNSDGGKAPARDLLAADDGADRPYHVAKAISGMMEDYGWNLVSSGRKASSHSGRKTGVSVLDAKTQGRSRS